MKKQAQKRKTFVNIDRNTCEYYFQEKFKNDMEIQEPSGNIKESASGEGESTYDEFVQVVPN